MYSEVITSHEDVFFCIFKKRLMQDILGAKMQEGRGSCHSHRLRQSASRLGNEFPGNEDS